MSLKEKLSGLLPPRTRIRFDRNEFSGAFGDIGLDIPLITAMILVSGLDPASVLIVFGLMQVFSALAYRIPMPVQPLKVVAALVIAQGLSAPLIFARTNRPLTPYVFLPS